MQVSVDSTEYVISNPPQLGSRDVTKPKALVRQEIIHDLKGNFIGSTQIAVSEGTAGRQVITDMVYADRTQVQQKIAAPGDSLSIDTYTIKDREINHSIPRTYDKERILEIGSDKSIDSPSTSANLPTNWNQFDTLPSDILVNKSIRPLSKDRLDTNNRGLPEDFGRAQPPAAPSKGKPARGNGWDVA